MSIATSVSYVDISEPDSIQTRINTKVLIIPASVVEISASSFENSIVENIIFIGDSQLKTIGKAAFKNCKFLKSIQIPPSVVEIDEEAFLDSSIEEVVFTHDSQLKTIGKGTFRDCKFLKSITIPDSVTHIESNSFRNSAIEEILFGENSQCIIIGQSAFQECSFLKSIEIPLSVLKIEYAAFSESNIQTVIFADDSRLETIGEYAFDNCKSFESIKIPSSVVAIDYAAFSESAIKEVIFSDDSKLEILSDFIFENCVSLNSMTIPDSVTHIGVSSFKNAAIEDILFGPNPKCATIGNSAFRNCRFLKSIEIPSSVLKIGNSAFYESSIQTVVFTNDSRLETIGEHAFYSCQSLQSIKIPSSVVEIDSCAFKYSHITEVIFVEKSTLEIIHFEAFCGCTRLKSIEIPDSVVVIAEKAFSGCEELNEVKFSINSKLQTIGQKAFFFSQYIKSFTFPESLREIGSFAFARCWCLPESITILSTSVEFLGDPFAESSVDEIIFGNSGKTQTTEKNEHFLQLCKEGNLSKCKEYIEQNHINLSYTKGHHICFSGPDNSIIEDAVSIAVSTKNVDLIIFLITNKVLMYSQFHVYTITEFFSNDDIFERVFFESATLFWYSICSFVLKGADRLIRRLLKRLKSKEYLEEWLNIFKNFHQLTPLQLVIQGGSLDFYHFLIDYGLITLPDLEVRTIEKYYCLALRFGYVAILKKSLEILPIKDISFNFTDFLMFAPQDRLYSMIEYTLPYILQNKDPLGFIVEGEYDHQQDFKFPETVLSYLAYAQAFDAFKYIIENVPNTEYTPSHLVACSLFRGYKDAKDEGDVDIRNFMKLFNYILQDDIRPHVLGEDKEWIGKSIFTCIQFGSSEMCMKLFSYGFDKDDVYIEVISDVEHNSLTRYSLLSYACRYQSLEVVKFLMNIGVNIDGSLLNHTSSSDGSGENDQNCLDIAMEDDEIESKSEHMCDDDDNDDDNDDSDDDDSKTRNDITNPDNYFFTNMYSRAGRWFDPYFNPYLLNKNQDIEIYYEDSRPFDASIEDPTERFMEHGPSEYLTLFNITPLGVAINAEDLDLVRLLLENGANPNAKTFSGLPHLFTLGMKQDLDEFNLDYLRKRPYVEYPDIYLLHNDIQDKKKNGEKMEDKSGDEDVSVDVSVEDNPLDPKFAIFQELADHGADLFHKQTVRDFTYIRRLNIYRICDRLNYSLDLLIYLQKIPQLGDKIKEYYIDSFRPTILDSYLNSEIYSLDTIDYMFQNGYLHFETYKEDEEFKEAVASHSQKGLKPTLEKYGFHFANLTNE